MCRFTSSRAKSCTSGRFESSRPIIASGPSASGSIWWRIRSKATARVSAQSLSTSRYSGAGSARNWSAAARIRAWAAARTAATSCSAIAASPSRPRYGQRLRPTPEQVARHRLHRRRPVVDHRHQFGDAQQRAHLLGQRLAGDPGIDVVGARGRLRGAEPGEQPGRQHPPHLRVGAQAIGGQLRRQRGRLGVGEGRGRRGPTTGPRSRAAPTAATSAGPAPAPGQVVRQDPVEQGQVRPGGIEPTLQLLEAELDGRLVGGPQEPQDGPRTRPPRAPSDAAPRRPARRRRGPPAAARRTARAGRRRAGRPRGAGTPPRGRRGGGSIALASRKRNVSRRSSRTNRSLAPQRMRCSR